MLVARYQIGVLAGLVCALALSSRADADQPRLVAVLPLNAPKLDKDLRHTLMEEIRTVAGDVLSPHGFIVLTGDNTLRILTDNGIDPDKACEANCALDAAKEMKASLFISGSVTPAEGAYVAFVRVFDGSLGRQLGSVELDGATVRDLRDQLKSKAGALFGAVLAPPVAKTSAIAASLLVFVKPVDKVRLAVIDPDGKMSESGVPFKSKPATPGTWKVTASAPGYQYLERSIVVPPDEPTELKFDLRKLGSLTVNATPADRVKLEIVDPDGIKTKSRVPFVKDGIKPGLWRVTATADGYVTEYQDVAVELESHSQLQFDLKPPPAPSAGVQKDLPFEQPASPPAPLGPPAVSLDVPPSATAPPDAVLTQLPPTDGTTRPSTGHLAGIVTLGLGGVALTVAAVLTTTASIMTARDKSVPVGTSVQASVNANNASMTGALIGWIGGGVLVATGVGLLVAF